MGAIRGIANIPQSHWVTSWLLIDRNPSIKFLRHILISGRLTDGAARDMRTHKIHYDSEECVGYLGRDKRVVDYSPH